MRIYLAFFLVVFTTFAFAKRIVADEGEFEDWQKEYLEKIQRLAREGGLPEEEWQGITKYDKDVCYSKPCLESALEFATATNFTVDPCQPNMWLEYVCARRLNGGDKLNQVERLIETVKEQTREILEDKAGAHENDLMFKEAQAYYYQCKNKGQNDDQDVKDILAYITEKYGAWPLFSGGAEPDKKFKWIDMVADTNRIERFGFEPLLGRVLTDRNMDKIIFTLGQPYFGYSEEDISEMMSRIGGKNPGEGEQIKEMVDFVKAVNNTKDLGQPKPKPMTIKGMQGKMEKAFAKYRMKMKVDWLGFIKRVMEGSGVEVTEKTWVIFWPEDVISRLKVVDDYLNKNARAVANALHFTMAKVLLQETTALLDDLATFNKTEEIGPRELICLYRTEEIFGFSLGKTYLKTYYDDVKSTPEMKRFMDTIKKGYILGFGNTAWMENSTKEFIQDKTKAITTFYAEPDWTKDTKKLQEFYKDLKGSKDKSSSYPLNYLSVTSWQLMKKMGYNLKWGERQAKGDTKNTTLYDAEWSHYLATVNAQYSNRLNQARIEGGIVQAPIFEVGRPGFMNFGGLGMVLAHEVGHSFDQNGRMFDKHGKHGEYWDKSSLAKYQHWVKRITEDYRKAAKEDKERPKETIDPSKTINEDIADILAVFTAFHSYDLYLEDLKGEGKQEKVLPGLKTFPPHKLFFMKYGNMWCEKKEGQARYNDLLSDHSPGDVRATLPLRRSKEFAETFGCPIPDDFD